MPVVFINFSKNFKHHGKYDFSMVKYFLLQAINVTDYLKVRQISAGFETAYFTQLFWSKPFNTCWKLLQYVPNVKRCKSSQGIQIVSA